MKNVKQKRNKRSEELYFLLSLADEKSYSAMMRKLRKGDKEILRQFQEAFKNSFDEAYCQRLDSIENIALLAALKKINHG